MSIDRFMCNTYYFSFNRGSWTPDGITVTVGMLQDRGWLKRSVWELPGTRRVMQESKQQEDDMSNGFFMIWQQQSKFLHMHLYILLVIGLTRCQRSFAISITQNSA